MLVGLGGFLRPYIERVPWTNVYGLARSLIALGTLGTIAFNDSLVLFQGGIGIDAGPVCDGLRAVSLFCVVPSREVGRLLAALVLIVVVVGWRPRFTALPHWWVSFSLFVSITVPDGGDQITAIITLLLLPLALTDSRPWHWGAAVAFDSGDVEASRVIAWSVVPVFRLQFAGLYLMAGASKLGVPEWVDGSATYYWLTDPMFGVSGWRLALVGPIIESAGVTLVTWGAIVVELVLATSLFATIRVRRALLPVGLVFHVLIALLHGLPSFSLAMAGGLLVYLQPLWAPFEPRAFQRFLRSRESGDANDVDIDLPEVSHART